MKIFTLGGVLAAIVATVALGCGTSTKGGPASSDTGGTGGSAGTGDTGGSGGQNEPQGTGMSCPDKHPNGLIRLTDAFASCGCATTGVCYKACSSTMDCGPEGSEPSPDFTDACGKCVAPASGGSPCKDLIASCRGDADCLALVQCLTGETGGGAGSAGAAGSPSAGGGAGTSGSSGAAGNAGGPHV